MYPLLRIIGFVIAGVCYATAFAMTFLGLVFLLTRPGWVLAPFVVVLAAGVVARSRRRQASVLLAYIYGAVRLNLPLPPMLRAAAANERGRASASLEGLADQLEGGATLSGAMAAAAPEVPLRHVSLIETGERTGRLLAVVTRLLAVDRRTDNRQSHQVGMMWTYPLAVLSTVMLVMLGLMIWVVPKFTEIFEDFGATFPPATALLVNFTRWLGGPVLGTHTAGHPVYWWAPVMVWVLVVILLIVTLLVAGRMRWGVAIVAPVAWFVPVWGRIERDRGLGDALHLMEQAVAAGATLPEALEEAARLRVNPMLRRRLRRWAERVAAGEDAAEAARAAGMPSLVTGLVATGAASGSLPQTLDFLHRFYDARHGRAEALLQAAVTPVTVLLLAVLVGWIAVAMFTPLVALMESVMPGWVVL